MSKKSTYLTLSLVIAAAAAVAGCGVDARPRVAPKVAPQATALSSCEQSKRLPPTLDGAARTGTEQQPVLVVGCKAN